MFRPDNHPLITEAKTCPKCKGMRVSLPAYPGDWFDCEDCGHSWEMTAEQKAKMHNPAQCLVGMNIKHEDGKMTGRGMMTTLADGTKTTITCADKVTLVGGYKGMVHCWTGGGVMVTLDKPITVDGLPPVKAFDCKGEHIASIDKRVNPATNRYDD